MIYRGYFLGWQGSIRKPLTFLLDKGRTTSLPLLNFRNLACSRQTSLDHSCAVLLLFLRTDGIPSNPEPAPTLEPETPVLADTGHTNPDTPAPVSDPPTEPETPASVSYTPTIPETAAPIVDATPLPYTPAPVDETSQPDTLAPISEITKPEPLSPISCEAEPFNDPILITLQSATIALSIVASEIRPDECDDPVTGYGQVRLQ